MKQIRDKVRNHIIFCPLSFWNYIFFIIIIFYAKLQLCSWWFVLSTSINVQEYVTKFSNSPSETGAQLTI